MAIHKVGDGCGDVREVSVDGVLIKGAIYADEGKGLVVAYIYDNDDNPVIEGDALKTRKIFGDVVVVFTGELEE